MPVALAGPHTRWENQEIDAELRQTRSVADFFYMGHDGGGAQDFLPTRAPARLRKHFLSRDAHSQRARSLLLSPAQDSDTHVRPVEFFCHSRARVWRPRESRILLEDVGKNRDSSRGSHARE